MLPLGTVAPDFKLPDTVSGKKKTLDKLKSPIATVIMFICNHCPYVQHIQSQLVVACHDFILRGIGVVAINANDVHTHPDDAPEHMAEVSQQYHYRFPYLFDEEQKVAKAYQAACTPDFFLFDCNTKLTYRGRFDNSTPGNGKPVTGNDLRQAMHTMIQDKPPLTSQIPSIGCNIKWRPENVPQYFS